jgi:group I intron endonuclease
VKNNSCGIYAIKNKINGMMYVGYAINIKRRWNHHLSCLRNNIHNNIYLQRSWNKYKENNFEFYIIEECDKNDLIFKEKYYIKKLKTKRPNGYNLNDGGDGNLGWIPTIKTLINKSIAVKGDKNPMYGKKHSNKTRKIFQNKELEIKMGLEIKIIWEEY